MEIKSELEKKIKELEEREKEIHEQEKELRVAKKEVEAGLRQAKSASSEDGKGDLEAEVRLRLDIFEEKVMEGHLQRKRARQNNERKRMEAEIRRVRIEEGGRGKK